MFGGLAQTGSIAGRICMRCGTVVDVPMDYQENTDLTTTEKNGYWIDRHRMVVEGICLDYQKEETDR